MVKCACGCGQEVVGPVVGVPTGEGDFVAFIPEHHQGAQTPVPADGVVCEDNPKTTKTHYIPVAGKLYEATVAKLKGRGFQLKKIARSKSKKFQIPVNGALYDAHVKRLRGGGFQLMSVVPSERGNPKEACCPHCGRPVGLGDTHCFACGETWRLRERSNPEFRNYIISKNYMGTWTGYHKTRGISAPVFKGRTYDKVVDKIRAFEASGGRINPVGRWGYDIAHERHKRGLETDSGSMYFRLRDDWSDEDAQSYIYALEDKKWALADEIAKAAKSAAIRNPVKQGVTCSRCGDTRCKNLGHYVSSQPGYVNTECCVCSNVPRSWFCGVCRQSMAGRSKINPRLKFDERRPCNQCGQVKETAFTPYGYLCRRCAKSWAEGDRRRLKRVLIRGNPFNPANRVSQRSLDALDRAIDRAAEREVGIEADVRRYMKERREHPTFTKAQIRQIVRDHRGSGKFAQGGAVSGASSRIRRGQYTLDPRKIARNPSKGYRIYYFDPADDSGQKWKVWNFKSLSKARAWREELGVIWDTPPQEIRIQDLSKPGGGRFRRNALPIGKIAQLAGVKGTASVTVGENPLIGTHVGCGGSVYPSNSPRTSFLCEKCGASWDRIPGRTLIPDDIQSPRRNADDGTINVHGSKITEVRYVEAGTGIPYKHKLEKPVRMKVRGGKVHLPAMTVQPEGITQ